MPSRVLVEVGHGHAGAELDRGVEQEHADAAGADHQRLLAGLQPAAAHGVHGDGHGLRQRRPVVAEPVRPHVDADLRRHRHVLRQPAVALEAHRGVVRREVRPPAPHLVVGSMV